MSGFSDAWEKMIMSHRFNISKYPTCELYVGLSSADPLDDRSGLSEPTTGKGYARVKTSVPGGTSWQVSSATGVSVNNSVEIAFAQATKDWGTLTHQALFSGATSGASVLASGVLTASKTVQTGDTPRFAVGALTFCMK